MNIVDLPHQAKRSEYDDAITRYAELVQSRAIAVYRVGNVTYPGVSDISLLVVTDRCSIDNQYFYSALQRMPRRSLPLFLREPFILPAWSLRVMCHTAHHAPALLAGRDVLRAFLPSNEPEERWCRTLEGYCTYAEFVAHARKTGTLQGRSTIALAGAFCGHLADAQIALGEGEFNEYAQKLDEALGHFYESGKPEENVAAVWALFSRAFDAFDLRLRAFLDVRVDEDASLKARKLLRGEAETAVFDREYAFRRAQAIDGYYHDLASMGFPYGHLFAAAAHPHVVRASAGDSLVGGMVRNLYRVRRRIEEYAGA